MTYRSWSILACLLATSTSVSEAQGPNPGQMADAYAAGAKANAQLMQKYTWKMRVQLTYNGEEKPASLYQMNYVGGQLQKTEISAPPEESGRKHGIKHRVKEDKMAEIKSQVEALIELTKKYMAPTPGQMFDFYSKATIGPAPTGGVQASGTNFIQPGDNVTYFINPATKSPTAYNFSTVAERQSRYRDGAVCPGAGRPEVRIIAHDQRPGRQAVGGGDEFRLPAEPVTSMAATEAQG